jgi:hypothetical protein
MPQMLPTNPPNIISSYTEFLALYIFFLGLIFMVWMSYGIFLFIGFRRVIAIRGHINRHHCWGFIFLGILSFLQSMGGFPHLIQYKGHDVEVGQVLVPYYAVLLCMPRFYPMPLIFVLCPSFSLCAKIVIILRVSLLSYP